MEDNPMNTLDIRVIEMPDNLKLEIRNHMIQMAIGTAVASVGTILTTVVVEKMKLRSKLKAARQIHAEGLNVKAEK